MSDLTFNADGKEVTGGSVGGHVVLFELSMRLDDLWMHPESYSDASTSLIARDALERLNYLERVLAQARVALGAMQMEAAHRKCGLKICDDSIAAIDEALK